TDEDVLDDLVHRGHVGLDEAHGLALQRPQALLRGELARGARRKAVDDALPQLIGDGKHLVDTDPVEVAGARTDLAARAAAPGILLAAAELAIQRQLRERRLVRLRAGV